MKRILILPDKKIIIAPIEWDIITKAEDITVENIEKINKVLGIR